MSEITINGKTIAAGHHVQYTDPIGVPHQALVKDVRAHYYADLQVHSDGTDRFLENVPFHPEGVKHSWVSDPHAQPETRPTSRKERG